MNANPIDPAMDKMSVAPGPESDTDAGNAEGKRAPVISLDAGTDQSISDRLARNPESKEARLDRALDESMDASDPPASTQPIHSHNREMPESSGYNPRHEAKLAGKGEQGIVGKLLSKIGLG